MPNQYTRVKLPKEITFIEKIIKELKEQSKEGAQFEKCCDLRKKI